MARQEVLEQNDRLTLLSQQLAGTKASCIRCIRMSLIISINFVKHQMELKSYNHVPMMRSFDTVQSQIFKAHNFRTLATS